jgi:putative SOS response-associated peptidase YedK
MPVILPREQEDVWLDPSVQDIPLLKSLIRPYDEEKMALNRE